MNPTAVPFTPEEDARLLAIRAQRPPPNWVETARLLGRGRSTVYKRWH